jgi:predicted metal-dependent hydrolase
MCEVKTLRVKDIDVMVYKKSIKNLHLNVLSPDGKVRVSAPLTVSDETIKLLIIKKYSWIKKHIKSFRRQERQTKREYISGESHYFKGKRYILKVEPAKKPKIEIKNKLYIYLYAPSHYTLEKREKYYKKWLRNELKKELEILVPKWGEIIGLKANEVRIKKMKTKWGSCNPMAKRIWINLELIKKPTKLLEYVVVHELIHLLERKHNKRFNRLMTEYLPQWKTYKRQLNEFIL